MPLIKAYIDCSQGNSTMAYVAKFHTFRSPDPKENLNFMSISLSTTFMKMRLKCYMCVHAYACMCVCV
jgi:hypothetical protein